MWICIEMLGAFEINPMQCTEILQERSLQRLQNVVGKPVQFFEFPTSIAFHGTI